MAIARGLTAPGGSATFWIGTSGPPVVSYTAMLLTKLLNALATYSLVRAGSSTIVVGRNGTADSGKRWRAPGVPGACMLLGRVARGRGQPWWRRQESASSSTATSPTVLPALRRRMHG